ncbi:MAG: transcription antitermination factor NusB [Patescibacteria group bacterium]|nr:transcription antitermination factor NusB [Patescibacteria group bacterium]MDE2172972.1 transcription antitermination factor NusB [Patescibacteria group bacterium]
MANRHLSRSVVLQSLFEWDSRGGNDLEAAAIIRRNAKEFAPGMADISFMEELTKGILAKKEDLNQIIEKAAPDWPIDKISPVDRNVLRLGLYELLFADRQEVPAKVAINEAIELAKTFGGETSGRFVNGVLGAVYKELGEPGKDAAPAKKKKPAEVPYDQMPIQHLGGAVVYGKEGANIYLAFVHDIFGHWTLSKGKIPDGVEPAVGTVNKVKEEIGLDVAIKADLGTNEYIANDPEIGKIRKQVHYYLAESDFIDLKLAKKPGLDDAKWFRLADILELNFYNDILPIVTKAVTILSEGK